MERKEIGSMNHQKKNWPQHRDCEHFTRTALDWGECAKGRGKVCGTGKQCVEKRYEGRAR